MAISTYLKPSLTSILLIYFVLNICSTISVNPNSTLFIDQYGRKIIFHGVNAVYKTFPFFPDLQKYSSNYSLTDQDLFNLRGWGFNSIRLHVAWEGVEPQRGQYNYTYIQKLREIVRKCNKYGIWVLLDAHQDLYSKKFCGQGFPDWAVERKSFPFPLKVQIRYDQQGYPLRQDCLKVEFGLFYTTQDLMRFQQEFFTNKRGILDSFGKMWKIVASYMSRQPNLLGYEIVNEPIGANLYRSLPDTILPGVSNNKFLLPGYKKIYAEIRKSDRQNLIFFEPSTIDLFGGGFSETPGGQSELTKQVFSYHVYCPYVTPLGEPVSTKICNYFDQLQVASKQINVRNSKIGGFLTQFGALSNSLKSAQQLYILTGLLESRFHSWTYWQFKYYNDITTAARPGTTQSFYDEYGNLQSNKVKALARPYAYAICGIPLNTQFNVKTSTFTLKWIPEQCYNMQTQLFLSNSFYYSNGLNVQFSKNCNKTCKLNPTNTEGYYIVSIDEKNIGKTVEIKITPKKK